MAQGSSEMDGKKIGMIVFALACVGVAGWLIYRNYAPPPPLPPPATPEEAKPSEPAPLPPNVKRPKPG